MKNPENNPPKSKEELEIENLEQDEKYKSFFSKDPYVVLGVKKDITLEDLRNIVRQLRIKYHPDANMDLPSTFTNTISQNINEAFEKIKRELESPKNSTKTGHPYQEQGGVHNYGGNPSNWYGKKPQEEEKKGGETLNMQDQREIKSSLMDNIRKGGEPDSFKAAVLSKVNKGFSQELINNFLKNDSEVKDFLKKDAYIALFSKYIDQPKMILQRITEWAGVGIQIESPDDAGLEKMLKNEIKLFIKINDPEKYDNLKKAWEEVRVSVDFDLNSSEYQSAFQSSLSNVFNLFSGNHKASKYDLEKLLSWQKLGWIVPNDYRKYFEKEYLRN